MNNDHMCHLCLLRSVFFSLVYLVKHNPFHFMLLNTLLHFRDKCTIWPKVRGHLTIRPTVNELVEHPILKPWALICSLTPCCSCNSLHSSWKSVWIFAHSAKRAFVRSGTDVGREGLTRNLRSNSSQRFSVRLKSRLCAGRSSSSTPYSSDLVFTVCTSLSAQGHSHAGTAKGPPQTVATKLEASSWLKCLHIL